MASMLVNIIKTLILIFLIFTCPNSGGAHALSRKEGNFKEEPNPCSEVSTRIYEFLNIISSDAVKIVEKNTKSLEILEEMPTPSKRIVKGKVMRKVLEMEAMLMDYNEPSANPSHEPRRGSPGGRASINP